MVFATRAFYNGPYRVLSIAFIAVVAVGGYFEPVIGLAVPGLMVLAMALNARSRRLFCSSACPNGRALSAAMAPVSRMHRLPAFLAGQGTRRALCGFMLFCVVNLLVRSGGGLASIGRVFWGIYLLAVGFSVIAGWAWKPRAWCAFCPMGTLQDTVGGAKPGSVPQ